MILYLDTSSLVKLYRIEEGSDEVSRQVASAHVVSTSVVAFPEARSAFARLAREGVLTAEDLISIREAFVRDWDTFLKVRAVKRLCERAGDLAEEFALRGFDALHLASYLELVEQAEEESVKISTFDARLSAAALEATASSPSR